MNLDHYYDEDEHPIETLPVDSLVRDFIAADFDRWADRQRPEWGVDPKYKHLRTCQERTWEQPAIEGRHSCGEGTCDYDPEVRAVVACPHRYRAEWSVEADTMGALLDAIHEFSEARRKRVDAFIGRTKIT